MKIKEAAQFMGVHPNTLRNWEKLGLIKPYRLGPRQDRYYAKWMLVRVQEPKNETQEESFTEEDRQTI